MPMSANEWQVILNTWDFLVENLHITDALLDDLISGGVLTSEDQQRINLEPVPSDKNEKLLNVLKHKPSECRAFAKLNDSLIKHESKFIADELDIAAQKVQKTDTNTYLLPGANVDTSVISLKKRIRTILVESFEYRQGLSCTLSEVTSVVTQVQQEGLNYNWNVDQLRNFVTDEVFVGVVFEKRKKRKPFKNIRLKEIQSSVDRSEDEPLVTPLSVPTGNPDGSASVLHHVSGMSACELGNFLLPKLREINLGEETANRIKEEDIDGMAFISLEEHHLKEHFSEMTLGKRLNFMRMKKQILGESSLTMQQSEKEDSKSTKEPSPKDREPTEPKRYHDTFHRFDTEVGAVDTYIKGRILETEGHSRGNLIIPKRHFICPQEEGTELCRKIAREAVIFASACMNERTNGTLHAGINPSNEDGREAGEIIGLKIEREKCITLVKEFIRDSFYEEHRDTAERAIRDVKFIQVTDTSIKSEKPPNIFVVEIDVVPSATLVGTDAFFVKTQLLGPRRKKRKQDLYRIISGELKPLNDEEIFSFMERKRRLTEIRAEQENKPTLLREPVDLRKKILNLFTGGSDTIEDDIYPLLFTSPLDPHMDDEFIKENLVFLQHFDARIVFDFDPKSSENGLYNYFDEIEHQCYTVLTTENFQHKDKKMDKVVNTSHRAWFFANGYSSLHQKGFQPFEWKQNRSEGFKEALRFYDQNIPNDRGIAVIFLFSKDYDVLLEAAEEILLKFKEQWMVIAENEEIAHLWKTEMTRRNVVNTASLEERCVIGMPWCDVNQTFINIIQPLKTPLCQLPLSTGALRELSEKDKNSMCDLEILSSNECDNREEVNDRDKIEVIRRRVEERFFRGGAAEWWDFWFGEDHVKKRQHHGNLMKEVETALATKKADEVGLVTLLHQPGAGGTTTSRQVLWDLRKSCKCCIIKRITDDTVEQIANLRRYGETMEPKPPLVLIDSDDEESFCRLLAELEDMSRKSARKHEESTNVFCVLLHCVRRASLPHSHEGKQIHLRHDLSPQELTWFRKKHDELQRKCEEHNGVDPKLLISFNLLKNNFDPDYVKRTVKELMNDIDDPKEQRLLRYLSFLNTYDIDFHTIPIACFDPIMGFRTKRPVLMQTGICRMGSSVRKKGWETNLGTSIRILLNESSNRQMYGAKMSTIRIISSFMSRVILATFAQSHTLSDIILDILGSEIFEFQNNNTEVLLGMLSNIVKKRKVKENNYLEKFSPLILEIMGKEGEDKAAEVFIEVFKLTNVAMVAQQLARLYIHFKNWPEAEKYASKATGLVQSNPFLWDTHAHVYEQQLKSKVESSVFTKDVILETVALAKKAAAIYKREQRVSETEINKPYNYNGYLGEVRAVNMLFKVLWKYQNRTGKRGKHAFLVDPDFVPDAFSFLCEDDIDFIKSCGKSAAAVIQKIEDELLQLKADTRHEYLNKSYFISLNDLLEIKEKLFRYYGESTDEVPESLSLEEQCEFRRRRVRQIGGTSLKGLLLLRFKDNDETNLLRVYHLIIQNLQTPAYNSFDLCTVLNTLVTMSRYEDGFVKTVPFAQVISLSQRLIDVKQEERPLLESFLYILLFNVPTPSRLKNGHDLCQSVTIRDTIKLWKEGFYNKYPRQRQEQKMFRKKDTTLYFLGHGDGMDEIVHYRQLDVREEELRVSDDFWHTSIAREKFLRYEGTLLMDGLEIQAVFQSPKGNKYDVCIPTSMPVKRSMWQKKVYFVLGFSWSGPKAFDVTLEDPSKTEVTKDDTDGRREHLMTTRLPEHTRRTSTLNYHREPNESRQYDHLRSPRYGGQMPETLYGSQRINRGTYQKRAVFSRETLRNTSAERRGQKD